MNAVARWLIFGAVAVLAACSGEGEGPEATSGGAGGAGGAGAAGSTGATSGGGAAATGGTAGAAAGQGGGGSSGSAGSSGDAGSGGGGGPSLACSGPFAAPEIVLEVAEPLLVGSPSVTADELELFYILDQGAALASYMVSVRGATSEDFPAGEPVPGLSDCTTDSASIDVSDDGLRIYYACWESGVAAEVYVAERGSRDEAFVPGRAVATMVGSSPAVIASELALYSGGILDNVPLIARRESLDADFGKPVVVPGLEGQEFSTPDASPDELVLFGRGPAAMGFFSRTTASDDFGDFTPLADLGTATVGAPALSADCSKLYFGSREPGPRAIQVMQRVP